MLIVCRHRLTAWLAGAALLSVALAMPRVGAEPVLQRFRAATITAADMASVERDYARHLGYVVRERGRVPAALARSWTTPRAAGRSYVLMSPPSAPDVFVRVVQGPTVARYRPLTTRGWNAIEIVVDDADASHQRLRGSPFRVIGEPANLSGYPSIRAFQVAGRAGEVI